MKFFDKQLLRRRAHPSAVDAKLIERRSTGELRKRMQYNGYLAFVKKKYQEQDLTSKKEDC